MRNFLRIFLAGLYVFQLTLIPVMADPAATTPSLTDLRAENDQVILELSQLMPYDIYTLSAPWRLVVEIPGTLYRAGFSKKDINESLVRRIRGYQYKENPLISRIVVDLASAVDYKTTADGNQVVISLIKNEVASSAVTEKKAPAAKATTSGAKKKDLLSTLPKEEVTLDFEGADIRDVVRLMAETSNINIIFGPEVAGTIAVHLKKVPFDEAFSTILNLKGLVASQLGTNILRVTTPDILQKERQKAIIFTKTIPINYLKAEEIQKHLQAIMTTSGRKGIITVVNQTNSVVVSDSEEGIGQAERLIAQLDRKPRQVMIEARIIEINLNNGMDIGVQWEFAKNNTKANKTTFLGNITDNEADTRLLFEDSLGTVIGGAAIPSAGGTGVNLPGPSAAGITFGFVEANNILSATLAALITQSRAKVLSAPKVVTVNGELAKIQAVQDIRFKLQSVTGTTISETVQVVSAGIILEVTPTINAEDRITLKVKPESSFPSQESTGDIPIIRTRTAQTTVIIKDGETLVIGGLIDDQDTKGVSKVPVLGDIPIIGVFFRSNTNRKTRNELLVFVTPRIVRD